MTRKNNEKKLIRSLIIEPEFEKDTLDPHKIIGGESIQLWMKKKGPTLCERCLQFGHPKKYCRSGRELCTNCAEQLQEGRMHDCRGNFWVYCKKPYKTGDKKICKVYKMEATIQRKMRLDKCDTYTAKEILGCRGRKFCVNGKRSSKKRIKTEKDRRRNKHTVKL